MQKLLLLGGLFYLVQSFDMFRNGTCLLFGRFLTHNSSFDFDLLQDQVMILSALPHNEVLNEVTRLRLIWSSKLDTHYESRVLTFHGFIEDTMKDTSCVVLLDGSQQVSQKKINEVPDGDLSLLL